jgi:predicted O-methyltransferase YrrM
MSKFKLICNAIEYFWKSPGSALIGARQEGEQGYAKRYIDKQYNMGNGFPDIDLLDLIPEFCETVDPYTYLSGGSLAIDCALLKGLARRYDKCSYLEIGVWRGESMAGVAEITDDCVSLSLSDDEIRKWTKNENYVAQNKFFLKNIHNITFVEENSLTYDFSKLGKKFDLIFVDADHSWSAVKSDTTNVFKLLKDENSIIVWHDYGHTPETVNWTTVAGILDGCPPEYKNHLYHVSNTKCAIFTREKLTSGYKQFPEIPNKVFEITIKAKKL